MFAKQKKFLFYLILVIIPIVFALILELFLRLINYGSDLSLFRNSEKYPGYYEINPNATRRYFTKFKNTSLTDDVFLINKPDTCYRIFVLGESTTRGFPFPENLSFPRILYFRLQDAFPHKRIEVVNISASALNSYIFVDMIDEILANKPDAILIYAGHNEYYGTFGVASVEGGENSRRIKILRLKLIRLRTFQLVYNTIARLASRYFDDSGSKNDGTLMERIVREKNIVTYSKEYCAGIEQFKSNLEELVLKAKAQNVPVVISDLVSNIRNQKPFISKKIDTIPAALDMYKTAQVMEKQSKFDSAKYYYYRAKDFDLLKFRAPEAINKVIYDIVAKYNNTFLASMKNAFEEASPNRLIGNNLMMEHLHPNIDGYFLMADVFFQTLKYNHLISDHWDTTLIKPSSYYRYNWGYLELDSLIGDLTIKVLTSGWPFRERNEIYNFLTNYKTFGIVDSLAFSYVSKEIEHVEDLHISLAKFYESLGLNDLAFRSYLSLIRMHPYIMDLYYDASKYLIAQGKYKDAYDLILSSPNKSYDYFYYYMLGTLEIKLQKYKAGIKHLEYSRSIIPEKTNPVKVLMPLYVAYKEQGDSVKMKTLSQEIQKYVPNFIKNEINAKPKIVKKALNVEESNQLALMLYKRGKIEDALKILQITIQKKETKLAYKLLGAIYYLKNEDNKALIYLKKAHQFDNTDAEIANLLVLLYLKHNEINSAEQVLTTLKLYSSDLSGIQKIEKMLAQKKAILSEYK